MCKINTALHFELIHQILAEAEVFSAIIHALDVSNMRLRQSSFLLKYVD